MAIVMRALEACLLMGMGGFMYWLSLSSVYWQFMNPKYSWLTMISGFALFAVGCACMSDSHRRRKASEVIWLTIFLVLAGTGLQMDDYFAEQQGMVEGGFSEVFADAAVQPGSGEPTVEFEGETYVRINTAELLQGEKDGVFKAGERFAFQGVVVRSEELDQAGLIGVGRLMIACCFADSVGAAWVVRVDDPTRYKDGRWVHVAGVLEPLDVEYDGIVKIQGALTAARSEGFMLAAENLEERPVEGVPFIFEMREGQPYAY